MAISGTDVQLNNNTLALKMSNGDIVILKRKNKTKLRPFFLHLISEPMIIVAMLVAIFMTFFILKQKSGVELIPVLSHDQLHKTNDQKVVSCYYNTPSQNGSHQLFPLDIHPHLCTHINVGFAVIKNKTVHLDNEQYKCLQQIVMLKKFNPNLKILLSIGGAHNDYGFSDMVVNHASRKTFIKSIKHILRNNMLDGIDLDWEFPSLHNLPANWEEKRERQHFSQLLREIRMEYNREKRNYLLTVAVAAPETIVNIAYDVDQINLYVDYVNIMTYDFHSFSKYTPFTGLNSPLYHRKSEQMYMATLNINYTVQMYINKGLDRNKIVVGIPTYGHSFKLVNVNNTGVGSPASGFGALGGLGFVNYPDICKFFAQFENEVVMKEDPDAKVPYLYMGSEWVSFDSPLSAMEKAQYIKEHKLRGAMIYSLNADDFAGECDEKLEGNVKFPLAISVKNVLVGETMKPANSQL